MPVYHSYYFWGNKMPARFMRSTHFGKVLVSFFPWLRKGNICYLTWRGNNECFMRKIQVPVFALP
jgi:hypothetical protein